VNTLTGWPVGEVNVVPVGDEAADPDSMPDEVCEFGEPFDVVVVVVACWLAVDIVSDELVSKPNSSSSFTFLIVELK